MQFAVVGDAAEAIFLAQAISASTENCLTLCSVTNALATEMATRGIAFELVDSPEEAIVDSATEAVVVACVDVDESMALCRQASQGGRHVVVIPPESVSTAFSFELHLLLDESERGIVPFFGRWYVDGDSSIYVSPADVRQLGLQLPMMIGDKEIQRAQLHGVDALAGCGYRFSRITGLDVPGADGALLSRSITLAAAESSEAKVPPAVVSFSSDVTQSGDVSIVITKTDGQIATRRCALPLFAASEAVEFRESIMQQLIRDLQSPDACQRRMEEFSNTLELMQGLEKSFRRRRTVDVYFDGISERSAFKTQMTAIGCGVMAYVTFGLITLAFLQAVGMSAVLLKLGMVLWIGPVVIFLLAQLLLPLARERERRDETAEPG